MSSDAEEHLLRVVEGLVDGGPVDWDEVVRQRPDLAPMVTRLRQLEAIALAHRGSRPQVTHEPSGTPAEPPLFHWGTIQVLEKIGQGGFAEVFRAWDLGLEREVALKLSRTNREDEASRVEHWLAEARRLAKVRHPNVLVIHGVDVREGRAGFWTDLIHGRTLENVLQDQGRLGAAEATMIGLDLCRALAAVHAAGLVHGDLKATNIMREGHRDRGSAPGAGRIVLMDFGAAGESTPSDSRSATFVTPLTCAPEVLRGEPPSPQSDLYSLGVLLYRLAAGRYPIESRDLAELETKIQLGIRTPLRDLRPELGAAFVAVVEQALDANPARRFPSAGHMERALSAAQAEDGASARGSLELDREAPPATARVGSATGRSRWRALVVSAVLLVAGASTGIALWVRAKSPRGSTTPIHFTIQPPPGMELAPDPNNLAISPDGSKLAVAVQDSTGRTDLWVRRLATHAFYRLAGTQGARYPFWSPSGTEIGFFSEGKMWRVRADGGGVDVICDAPRPRGGTWGRKGVIVFSPSVPGPLFQVPASGGSPTAVTAVDSTRGTPEHVSPWFLPDGEHFTYVARPVQEFGAEAPPTIRSFQSYIGSTRSLRAEPLLVANSAPMFAPPHHLIYVRNEVLIAQPFDARRHRLTGPPVPIPDSPSPVVFVGTRCGSVSTNGVLVWRSSGSPKVGMVWIDRAARRIARLGIPADRWERVTISPDGRRAIIQRALADSIKDLWVLDLQRETMVRLTPEQGLHEFGTWSPDSREIIYAVAGPGGVRDLHRRAVDGPALDRTLYRSSARLQSARSWSGDGEVLIEENKAPGGYDLLVVPAAGGAAKTYLATPFDERLGMVSPDGRWALYSSRESGSWHAYVESFPTPGKKQQVSKVPVIYGVWGRGGREILLFTPDFRLLSVPVLGHDELRLGAPEQVFQLSRTMRWFSPSPDGLRFLMLEPNEATAPAGSIAVSVNWMAGLER